MARFQLLAVLLLVLAATSNAHQVQRVRGAPVKDSRTPGQKRMVAAVVHRPANKPQLAQALGPRAHQRAALVTKAGAKQDGATTHAVYVAPPVVGGPPVFTTRKMRVSSVTTKAATANTATATQTTSTAAGTTGTTTAIAAAGTTCATCALAYYATCTYPAVPCTGPCCSAGMACSYSNAQNYKCFPPLV